MADSRVPGSCFCLAIRFHVGLPTLFCGHCHCSMCRRSHGAGFVTWLVTARDRFSLDRDDGLVRFPSSGHATRSFCSHCGSTLFFESSLRPDQIDVVLANMDGPVDRSPEAHIHFDDRTEWAATDDGLPRLGGATGLEPIVPDESSEK